MVDANDTRIKVRRPAEWRLLDLSQPMIADKMTDKKSRKRMDQILMLTDQGPRNDAIGSRTDVFIRYLLIFCF
jgi:hypothetical protein